jgi:transposase
MQAVTTIGLDIAKSVFQVHGVDAEGNVIIWRKLKRRYIVAFFQKLLDGDTEPIPTRLVRLLDRARLPTKYTARSPIAASGSSQ